MVVQEVAEEVQISCQTFDNNSYIVLRLMSDGPPLSAQNVLDAVEEYLTLDPQGFFKVSE